eukprot:Hpha_TRINITY_DN27167_c0_g1::TRINITY_DN27167_c0_g1_i1::g.29274::m.29274/K00472/P4HA; prolyl 4-hydroxylase
MESRWNRSQRRGGLPVFAIFAGVPFLFLVWMLFSLRADVASLRRSQKEQSMVMQRLSQQLVSSNLRVQGKVEAIRIQKEVDTIVREAEEPHKQETRPVQPVVPPYLALFEREGKDEGDIWRDDADGGREGSMHWKALSKAKPRLLYIENFLSDEEAEQLVEAAKPKIKRSTVVATSGDATNSVRTSQGMFLDSYHERNLPAVKASALRTSVISGLPVENIEALQVLRYTAGQRYLAHPDYFMRQYSNHLSRGGQRVATILFWLSHQGTGGNTSFPMTQRRGPGKEISVPPKRGDAILFYNCASTLDKDNFCTEDPYSQHQGNPPGDGSEKWVGVYWIRQRKFT